MAGLPLKTKQKKPAPVKGVGMQGNDVKPQQERPQQTSLLLAASEGGSWTNIEQTFPAKRVEEAEESPERCEGCFLAFLVLPLVGTAKMSG